MKSLDKIFLAFWCSLLLTVSPMASAQSETGGEGTGLAAEAVEPEVRAEADAQTDERRKKIIEEAVQALAKTKEALRALEEERIDEALEALALATGKLELIVARDPQLALATTDVTITTHDLFASAESIRRAIERAKDALDDGAIQEARRLLNTMGSEIVISVTNLPLATYPEAIKAITPLIDEGEIEAAKSELTAALNTLVVIDHVVPLPVLRSERLLEHAEELVGKADRTEDEEQQLTKQLAAVRDQLEMAELLGYGDKEEFEELHAELDRIEARAEDGEFGDGIFDQIRASLGNLAG